MYLTKKIVVFAIGVCLASFLPITGVNVNAEEVGGEEYLTDQFIIESEDDISEMAAEKISMIDGEEGVYNTEVRNHIVIQEGNQFELFSNYAISPRMTYLVSVSPSLSIDPETGLASIYVSADGITSVNRITMFVYLQKKVDGAWLTTKSWEFTEAKDTVLFKKTYSVARGTYRVTAWVYGFVGPDDSEDIIVNSTSKTY